MPWRDYLRPEMDHYELWRGIFEHVTIPEEVIERYRATPARGLLVIAADWCGDAANTVPVFAELAERAQRGELRMLERDDYPELMKKYLTNGSRSIPIAIALDANLRELAHWGPRPGPLQEWMLANKAQIPSPQRYAFARRWYAKDKGKTTLEELLSRLERPETAH